MHPKGKVMRNSLGGISLTLATMVLNTPATAGPLVDKATQAEQLFNTGDAAGALARLNEAMELAWEAGPMLVRTPVYVDSAAGYGQYTERAQGSTFRPDEKQRVYVEVLGYGYGEAVVGLYQIGFDVDVRVMTKAGELIVGKQDLTSFDTSLRAKAREFYASLTLSFPGIPVGEYDMFLRLRDQNSDKYAVFQMPLTIVE